MNDSRTVTFPVADTTRIVRCFVRPDGKNDTEELWTPAMDEQTAPDSTITGETIESTPGQEDPVSVPTESPSGATGETVAGGDEQPF